MSGTEVWIDPQEEPEYYLPRCHLMIDSTPGLEIPCEEFGVYQLRDQQWYCPEHARLIESRCYFNGFRYVAEVDGDDRSG